MTEISPQVAAEAHADAPPFIIADKLVKEYQIDSVETLALDGLDLEIKQGEVVAIVGPSGSGKSTLLNILGGLDQPTKGTISVGGIDIASLTGDGLRRYRRDVVGFVWQQNARNMLPYLTAQQNVALPMKLKGIGRRQRNQQALELLAMVGMADRAQHRTPALSGGEQQRVAIAIAMANSPGLLLADEPTGSVDSQTAGIIIDLFRSLADRYGVTVVIVSHDPSLSDHVDRTIAIYDGRTSFERVRQQQDELTVGYETTIMIDKHGRLQLPPQAVAQFDLTGQVRLHVAEDHLQIWPAEEDKPGD